MSTINEIESAIELLPSQQVEELAAWLEKYRAGRVAALPINDWFAQARGAARPDATTARVMAVTRGEE